MPVGHRPTLLCENSFTYKLFKMSNTSKNPGEQKDETKQPNAAEVTKGVENHKQAAAHHQEAAKHHLDAAKHHEEGNHEKAHASAILANGHSCMACECQKEDVKHHALNAK